ncbi:MAG: hypothetical protein MUF26_04560, partial [Syntrophales bacterium]|nr:hypothetical protein [Syntrophales bacterium]
MIASADIRILSGGLNPAIYRKSLFVLHFFLLYFLISGCTNQTSSPEVIIYTSVDQVYSEPVLQAFEKKTGIRVRPVYDIEASKTTGLVNRLIAEKDRPQADVFWSGEFVQTLLLKDRGVLAPYDAPNGRNLPALYRDPAHL